MCLAEATIVQDLSTNSSRDQYGSSIRAGEVCQIPLCVSESACYFSQYDGTKSFSLLHVGLGGRTFCCMEYTVVTVSIISVLDNECAGQKATLDCYISSLICLEDVL